MCYVVLCVLCVFLRCVLCIAYCVLCFVSVLELLCSCVFII